MQSFRFWSLVVATGIAMFYCFSASGETKNFVVTTTEDVLDYVCPTNDPPDPEDHCSLRDAVWESNSTPDPDTIELPAGVFHLTVAGDDDAATVGDLDISSSVIIAGQGPGLTIIDATGLNDRVFEIVYGVLNVGLANLTITGGFPTHPQTGGGILHNQGDLVLSNVRVAGNSANYGGGIMSSGADTLTVQDASVIIGNSAYRYGGGIWVSSTDFSVSNSTITANTAALSGGGIGATSAAGGISFSTISYNAVTSPFSGGGGLFVTSTPGDYRVDVFNSTIAENRSVGAGGAIYVGETGRVRTLNVTIDKNQGELNSILYSDNILQMANTIIVGLCHFPTFGSYSSLGGNIESPSNSCVGLAENDQANVIDPMLGPLGDFGGPTATILPLAGSPAVGNHLDTCPVFDQRGFLRDDGDCDSGAVERRLTDPIPIFVDGFESGATTAWSEVLQ